ncbi:MAG: DNA primase [Butyricicoccus pullicaecorum]|nr:DNA primase [Butyricicoccus pullicaecorum]
MAMDHAFLDELTARNDIVDVVSRYVALKRQGANYFGLCPFHNEKSASFSVSPDKQIYYCFGCGAGGGVINFVMRAEGLEFRDAVQFLADRSGLQVPQNRMDEGAARRRERMLALLKDAGRFFYDTLWLPEYAPVQQYFARRGLNRKTMNRFGLGYAPDSFHQTMDAMQKKGYTKEELVAAGLAVKNEKGAVYDKFRNRVMFPIIDVRGQVVAFGGRVMDDSKPKYLNSPETMVFHKGRNLFALNLAKKTQKDYFILAEGYMDVIALHQAGFDSAVASLGTSLTEEQARMIARYTKKIVIAYDADGAGQAAAQRAIDILKRADLQVHVLRIPEAKDPDELIKTKGAEAFRRLIEHSEGHNAYRLEQIAGRFDLNEDEQRVAFVQEAAKMLAAIDGEVEREVYAGRAAKMAGITQQAMTIEVRRALNIRRRQKANAEHRAVRAVTTNVQPRDRMLHYPDLRAGRAEEGVLALLFTEPSLVPEIIKRLRPADFSAPVLAKIYTHALTLETQGIPISISGFEGYLEDGELALLSEILSRPITALEGRQRALNDYIEIMEERRTQRKLEQPQESGGEDPMITFSRMKAEKMGGK